MNNPEDARKLINIETFNFCQKCFQHPYMFVKGAVLDKLLAPKDHFHSDFCAGGHFAISDEIKHHHIPVRVMSTSTTVHESHETERFIVVSKLYS